MKVSHVLLLICSLAIGTFAQQQSPSPQPTSPDQDCPDVAVQSFAWGVASSRVVNLDPSFAADIQSNGRGSRQAATTNIPSDAPTTPVRMPGNTPIPRSPTASGPQTVEHVGGQRESYVLVKNSGSRVIRAIYWDYVFFTDEAMAHELKRHKFHTKKRIAPGETKFLSEFVNGHADSQYQKVFINRVEFSDGSVWSRQ
jgi:hypothetical protein